MSLFDYGRATLPSTTLENLNQPATPHPLPATGASRTSIRAVGGTGQGAKALDFRLGRVDPSRSTPVTLTRIPSSARSPNSGFPAPPRWETQALGDDHKPAELPPSRFMRTGPGGVIHQVELACAVLDTTIAPSFGEQLRAGGRDAFVAALPRPTGLAPAHPPSFQAGCDNWRIQRGLLR